MHQKVGKRALELQFKMSEANEPRYCLGLEIHRDRKRRMLKISQKKYVMDSLEKFNLSTAHPTATPLLTGVKLTKSQAPGTTEEQLEMANIP